MTTLQEAKDFLKIEHTEEDVFISSLLLASDLFLTNATDMNVDKTTELFKMGQLLLLSHWYENRSTVIVGQVSKQIEYAVEAIIQQLKYTTVDPSDLVLSTSTVQQQLDSKQPLIIQSETTPTSPIDQLIWVDTLHKSFNWYNGTTQMWESLAGGGSGSGSVVTKSVQNGYVNVDGTDTLVFDSSSLESEIAGKEPAFTKKSAFNKDFGGSGTSDTVSHSDHAHRESDITDLDKYSKSETNTLLNGKIDNPPTKSDGQLLKYNATSGKWEAQNETVTPPTSVTDSENNGNILVNGSEIQVFDASSLESEIAGKIANPTTKTDKQVLTFNATSGQWEAQTPQTGSSGATKLDDLTDVDTSTTPPSDTQVLTFDGTKNLWIPKTPQTGSSGVASVNGKTGAVTLGASDVSAETVIYKQNTAPTGVSVGQLWVDTSVSPNYLKKYNGSGWEYVTANINDGQTGTLLTWSSNQISNQLGTKEPKIYKQTSAPTGIATGQLWVDTTNTPYILKQYDGALWQTVGQASGGGTSSTVPVGAKTRGFENENALPTLGDMGELLFTEDKGRLYLTTSNNTVISPTMTASTAPTGYAVSSSSNVSGYEPWKLMDGSVTTQFRTVTNANEWWQIQFPSAVSVGGFTLASFGGNSTYIPTKFYLAASTDGTTWVQVSDTFQVTADMFTGGYTPLTFRTNKVGSYAYYRLNLVAGNGGSYIGAFEMKFFGVQRQKANVETKANVYAQTLAAGANTGSLATPKDAIVQVQVKNGTVAETPIAVDTTYNGHSFASGTYSTNYPNNAFKNDATYWASAASPVLAWIEYLFDSLTTISQNITFNHQSATTYYTTSVDVYVTYDGNSWVLLTTITGMTAGNNTIVLPSSVSIRGIRFVQKDINGSYWEVKYIEFHTLAGNTYRRMKDSDSIDVLIDESNQLVTVTNNSAASVDIKVVAK